MSSTRHNNDDQSLMARRRQILDTVRACYETMDTDVVPTPEQHAEIDALMDELREIRHELGRRGRQRAGL